MGIDKVLESDWGEGEREKVVLAVQLDDDDVEMKSCLRPEELDEKRCQKLFSHFDMNGSGEIDMRELGLLIKGMGMRMEQEAINNAMIDLDKDNNGAISFDEFWSWFQDIATGRSGPTGGASMVKQKMKSVMAEASMKESHFSTGGRSKDTIKPPTQAATGISLAAPEISTPKPATPFAAAPLAQQQQAINYAETTQADRADAESPRTAGSWRRCSQPGGGRARPSTAAGGRDGNNKQAAWGSDGWRSVSRSDFRAPSAHGRALPPRLKIDDNERANQRSRPMSAHPMVRGPATDPNTGTVREICGSPSGFRL